MPANTPLGIPYPLGSDRVMDGDNAIQAVAQYLDSSITWGACYVNGEGAGVNQTRWFATCLTLGASPGVTVNGNGITVPRKGYYLVQANAQFTFNQNLPTTCTLFVGDGSGQWNHQGVEHITSQNPSWGKPLSCQTVVLLNAGAIVRWGCAASGATSAGIPADGALNNSLFTRLLHAVA